MPELPPAPVTGDLAGRAAERLTPDAIDSAVADFRAWLEDVAAGNGPAASSPLPEPPDLHTLLGQMTALRHEVNLQTKAVRAQQEQNSESLRELGRALDLVEEASSRTGSRNDDEDSQLRPVLKTLLDIADALTLARREFQRGRQAMAKSLEPAPGVAPAASWWQRLFPRQPVEAKLAADRVLPLLESLVTGYTMSIQRVERALEQYGLERITCVGAAFDPERMEVVEAVADSGRPAGQVVEEIRPGYLWRGRVFRFAQVSVARPTVG